LWAQGGNAPVLPIAPLQKSGIVWNEATLTKWTAGPAKVVPGTKMALRLSSKSSRPT